MCAFTLPPLAGSFSGPRGLGHVRRLSFLQDLFCDFIYFLVILPLLVSCSFLNIVIQLIIIVNFSFNGSFESLSPLCLRCRRHVSKS